METSADPLSILQLAAIFVLSGTKNDIDRETKNDIAGQKTISRDKKQYHGTYRFYVTVLLLCCCSLSILSIPYMVNLPIHYHNYCIII